MRIPKGDTIGPSTGQWGREHAVSDAANARAIKPRPARAAFARLAPRRLPASPRVDLVTTPRGQSGGATNRVRCRAA